VEWRCDQESSFVLRLCSGSDVIACKHDVNSQQIFRALRSGVTSNFGPPARKSFGPPPTEQHRRIQNFLLVGPKNRSFSRGNVESAELSWSADPNVIGRSWSRDDESDQRFNSFNTYYIYSTDSPAYTVITVMRCSLSFSFDVINILTLCLRFTLYCIAWHYCNYI